VSWFYGRGLKRSVLGKNNSMLWQFQRFFSIQNYFDNSDDLALFNFKISAVKEYIPVLFLINIHMFFMKLYKGYQTKKKTKRRKTLAV
jgi:hypothetical protein